MHVGTSSSIFGYTKPVLVRLWLRGVTTLSITCILLTEEGDFSRPRLWKPLEPYQHALSHGLIDSPPGQQNCGVTSSTRAYCKSVDAGLFDILSREHEVH
ncbi:hypothetical protein Trydic_g12608 [Trypoxylus dichotomus]